MDVAVDIQLGIVGPIERCQSTVGRHANSLIPIENPPRWVAAGHAHIAPRLALVIRYKQHDSLILLRFVEIGFVRFDAHCQLAIFELEDGSGQAGRAKFIGYCDHAPCRPMIAEII